MAPSDIHVLSDGSLIAGGYALGSGGGQDDFFLARLDSALNLCSDFSTTLSTADFTTAAISQHPNLSSVDLQLQVKSFSKQTAPMGKAPYSLATSRANEAICSAQEQQASATVVAPSSDNECGCSAFGSCNPATLLCSCEENYAGY